MTGWLVRDHETNADFRRANGPTIGQTSATLVELCRRIGVLKGEAATMRPP